MLTELVNKTTTTYYIVRLCALALSQHSHYSFLSPASAMRGLFKKRCATGRGSEEHATPPHRPLASLRHPIHPPPPIGAASSTGDELAASALAASARRLEAIDLNGMRIPDRFLAYAPVAKLDAGSALLLRNEQTGELASFSRLETREVASELRRLSTLAAHPHEHILRMVWVEAAEASALNVAVQYLPPVEARTLEQVLEKSGKQTEETVRRCPPPPPVSLPPSLVLPPSLARSPSLSLARSLSRSVCVCVCLSVCLLSLSLFRTHSQRTHLLNLSLSSCFVSLLGEGMARADGGGAGACASAWGGPRRLELALCLFAERCDESWGGSSSSGSSA